MFELRIGIHKGHIKVLVEQKIVMAIATDQRGNIYKLEYKLANAHPKYNKSFSVCGYIKDIASPKSLFFMRDITDDWEVENLIYDDTSSYRALYQTNLLSFYHWQVENEVIKIEIGHNM